MKKIAIIVLGILLISCKKFSHETPPLEALSCKSCAYADALNGSYEGTISGILIPFTSSPYVGGTTMIVQLEHVFLNKGAYIDSTIMFMKFTTIFPQFSDTSSRIFTFEELNGNVTNYTVDEFFLTADSIYLYDSFYSKYTGETVKAKYTGLRQ